MKRILAFICVMACLLGLSLPAMAAPDMITVTAQVPEDWTNVHLYTWVDENINLMTWPGTAMTKADDGRWTIEIPSGYPYLIINDGGAGNQTVDTPVGGDCDIWLIVEGHGNAASCEVHVSDPGLVGGNTTPPTTDTAAPLTSLAIVGEGIDGINWDPASADGEMTKVEEGIYTKELTLYKGTSIKFKLCGNDSWDGGYNLGGESEGITVTAGTAVNLVNNGDSKDLTYTASQDCTVTITADLTGETPSVKIVETKTELAPPPVVEYVKVYVSLPAGITPNLWAWGDNGNAFPAWPGNAMTKSGDWWTIEIPDNCHSAIVNDGSSKTTDLSITMGADNWIVVAADWTAQTYTSEPKLEEPAPAPTPDSGTTNTQPTTTNPTQPKDEAKTDSKDDKAGVSIFMIITIVMAVAAVAAVVVTVIILKKRNQ